MNPAPMRALPWLLLAALLAACGGSARAAVTEAEYESVVTRQLDSVAEPLAALEGVSEYDALVDRLEEGEARAKDAVARLRAIEPPPGLHDENQALITGVDVLAEDFHRAAETLRTLQEEGMPPEYAAMLETLRALRFDGVELLRDALAALRLAGVHPGGPA